MSFDGSKIPSEVTNENIDYISCIDRYDQSDSIYLQRRIYLRKGTVQTVNE